MEADTEEEGYEVVLSSVIVDSFFIKRENGNFVVSINIKLS